MPISHQVYWHQFVKMLDKPIDVDEIKEAALKLKNGKSVGIELISNEMIKRCVDSHFVRLIRDSFNFILVESKVPTCWKQGLITPIFKSGEIYNPSDYRGITVTGCLSKLFTLIINERWVSFIDIWRQFSSPIWLGLEESLGLLTISLSLTLH